MPRQPVLPFSPRIDEPVPYRPSPSQLAAAETLPRLLQAVARGSGLTSILIVGPKASGKSRLLEELFLTGSASFEAVAVHEIDSMQLFAEINRAASARQPLMIETRQQSARLFASEDVPPDLRSRIRSLPELRLERPAEEALAAALKADLAVHGLSLKARELRLVLGRLPRHFAAVRRFCRALDRAPAARTSAERLNLAMELAQQEED